MAPSNESNKTSGTQHTSQSAGNGTRKTSRRSQSSSSSRRRSASGSRTGSSARKSGSGRSASGRSGQGRSTDRSRSTAPARKKETAALPPVDADTVRIIPLGGVEEVGRNMTALETADDIVIFDAGFQFVSDEAPGIDYVLPNTRYLEERKEKVRALLVTHGHLDHIGGIPYIMERIGNPPIYTNELTALMIKKRAEEFPQFKQSEVKIMGSEDSIRLGKLKVQAFPVTHSIPDSMGFSVETKYGNVVISGDLKLDHVDGIPIEREQDTYNKLSKNNNLLLIADSTNAEKGGFSMPEPVVYQTLEDIITAAQGRVIIGTFASQFERMIKIIEICEKLNKKIVPEGRSIKTNLEIAEIAKRLHVKKDTIIPPQEIDNYPPDKIVIIATGAQGEEFAALSRIATGKHKFIKLSKRDTVVLSSSVIPGNEISVQRLKDNLYRHAGKVIHYRASDVHSTGHGNTGELVWINQKVNPKFFMPAYGYYSMLRCHANAVIEAGFPEKNVIMADNGMLIDIVKGEKLVIQKESAPASPMMVDGFSIGDVQDVVIRDRKSLSQDGMFVVIATINLKTGKLRKSPDIISRGFVYLRESQDLLQQTRLLIKKSVEESTQDMHPINFDYVKDNVTDEVARFLFQKTNKHPIVIPVLLGV